MIIDNTCTTVESNIEPEERQLSIDEMILSLEQARKWLDKKIDEFQKYDYEYNLVWHPDTRMHTIERGKKKTRGDA